MSKFSVREFYAWTFAMSLVGLPTFADMVTLTESFGVDPVDRLQWVGDSTGIWRPAGGNSEGYLEFRGDTRSFSDAYFPELAVTLSENGSVSISVDFYVEPE